MTKKKTDPLDKPPGSRSILINFVLDKSGSMSAIRDATISGFNEFKNDQVREDGEALFTLTLFDTGFLTVCRATPVRQVSDLDLRSYEPDGCTALYDAIGHTMRVTDDYVSANNPEQVLFVVMTDGEENSSREFTRDRIFEMIRDRQENAGYEFMYLGANQDSYAAGASMGLRDGRMLDWAASPEAARSAMRRASHNVSAHRRTGNKQSAVFFSAEMDALGAIDAATWSAMPDDEKADHLRK